MRSRNNRGRFTATPLVDVRKEKDIPAVQKLIHNGPVTFVLVYADWCGHCTQFKPTWGEYANTPGRTANIASVHHDMVENIPEIANAKIQGYPSVVKITPSGEMSEYKVPGTEEKTNALPYMRETATMKKELTTPVTTSSSVPSAQAGIVNTDETLKKENVLTAMKGGASVVGSFLSALQTAGPAAVLLFAHSMLPKKNKVKTYKSPKKSSRRASTRKNRRH